MSTAHNCESRSFAKSKKPKHTLAQIVAKHGADYAKLYTPVNQVKKTIRAIALCKTAVLGGHIRRCQGCQKEVVSYNSCRNRHCPQCQAVNREKWIMAREAELLNVPYFHLVFTIPEAFNQLLPKYAKEVYSALFSASWQTVNTFAEDEKHLGAKPGMISILHTWGQQLWLHPHVHCIVPAGGVTKSGKWKNAKYANKYLFPKRAMSNVFRAQFMAELRQQITVPQSVAKKAFQTKWVVYAKRPFTSPKTVVEYLGRYTHRVAISNHRLLEVNQHNVRFAYKDYRAGGKKRDITVTGIEFLRRFAAHVLPAGFVRIRHYGFLASKNKAVMLNAAKAALGQEKWEKLVLRWEEVAKQKMRFDPHQCPHCKKGVLMLVRPLTAYRGPPLEDMKNG